jgi:hypothetical protein
MRLPRILLNTLLVAAIAGPALTRADARAVAAPAAPTTPQTRFSGFSWMEWCEGSSPASSAESFPLPGRDLKNNDRLLFCAASPRA